MSASIKPAVCSATEMERRLHNKYHGDDFALCFEVRNAAGFSADRSCDALGIGLWPSRGCHVYGFEVKVTRSDWLRELKSGAKAEAFVPYCDYWFVVAGSREIVRQDELPGGWGLIVPRGEGLAITVPGVLNKSAREMPRGMLAAFVKRASMQNPNAGVLKQKYDAGVESGIARGKAMRLPEDGETERYKSLRLAVDKFKAATSIDPEYFYDAAVLKQAMAYVTAGKKLGRTPSDLRTIAHQLRASLSTIDEAAKLADTVSHEMAAELKGAVA